MKNTTAPRRRPLVRATLALAIVGATLTGTTAVSVAAAPAAEAVTYSQWGNCRWLLNHFVCQRWVNYNLWEEIFQGKFDGWEYRSFKTR